MRCGRGAQQFDRTGCGNAVEYTYLGPICQTKKACHTLVAAEIGVREEVQSKYSPPSKG
jgi:hypothetical protein